MQSLAEQVAFDQVASEYAVPVQIAGLRTSIIEICKNDAATPDELRRSLTRQLQATLPKSVPLSVRADASSMPDAEFARTEAKVKAAVVAAAHDSPTLRAVVSKDRAGREVTEFFGKKSWMGAYARQPQLMVKIDGSPVRLPVIL
jgi:hypothetical protein